MKFTDTSLAGEICIKLRVENGTVMNVSIFETPPVDPSALFSGRNAFEVVKQLGSLYSLCARAQTIAALNAVEDALDLVAPPRQQAARNVLRLAEILSQTALRLCLDWPRLLELESEPELVRNCLKAEKQIERHMFGNNDWRIVGAARSEPDIKAAMNVVDELQARVDDFLTPGGLAQQIREALKAGKFESIGALKDGAGPEDGAFRRQHMAPAVRKACDRFGLGLAARLEARLVELAALPGEIVATLDAVAGDGAPVSIPSRNDSGWFEVETVRGRLSHRVSLNGDNIATYDINAPTRYNFREDGPVATGLAGLSLDDDSVLIRAAELHVLAIDPCVQFQVELSHA